MAKCSASDEDIDIKRHKKSSNKFKEREDNSKKYRKKNPHFIALGENKSHTSREYKFLKARPKDKDNTEFGKKDYKKKFKELNLFQAEASHQNHKYEKLNKSSTKKKTPKEDTVVLDDSSDSNSSSSSESEITLVKLRKPQLPTIQILLTMTKSAADLLSESKKN